MGEVNSFVDNGLTLSDYITDEKEQEANYFAACLRMPEDAIVKKAQLDNQKNEIRVRNLLKSAGGNAALNEPSNVMEPPLFIFRPEKTCGKM